jgi:hypothetical protein
VRRFPKAALIAGALLMGLHVGVLLAFGVEGRGPMLSNLAQLLMGVVCIATLIEGTRGRPPFERRFLVLVALRYVLWGTGQVLSLTDDPDAVFEGSFADIVFHLEDLPLGVALFLDPGRDDRLRWAPAVDLVQPALFWLATYLYWHYMPAEQGAGAGEVADAVVAGAFYFRAVTTRSHTARALFGRWTPAIVLSTVHDAYAGFFGMDVRTGHLFDLVWSGELMLWILTAASWDPLRTADGSQTAIDPTVRHLPLVLSCFTAVMAWGIAGRKPGVGAAVFVLTAACSVAHVAEGRRRRLAEEVRA